MKIFIAFVSAVVLGLALLLNNYLSSGNYTYIPGIGIDLPGIGAHFREIGLARLGLWLTPLLVAQASIVALLRMREKDKTATTGTCIVTEGYFWHTVGSHLVVGNKECFYPC